MTKIPDILTKSITPWWYLPALVLSNQWSVIGEKWEKVFGFRVKRS